MPTLSFQNCRFELFRNFNQDVYIYIFFPRFEIAENLEVDKNSRKLKISWNSAKKKGGSQFTRQTTFERIQKFKSVFKIFNIKIPRLLFPNIEENLRKKRICQNFTPIIFIPLFRYSPVKCTINDPLYIRVIEITSFQQKSIPNEAQRENVSRDLAQSGRHVAVDFIQLEVARTSSRPVYFNIINALGSPRHPYMGVTLSSFSKKIRF